MRPRRRCEILAVGLLVKVAAHAEDPRPADDLTAYFLLLSPGDATFPEIA